MMFADCRNHPERFNCSTAPHTLIRVHESMCPLFNTNEAIARLREKLTGESSHSIGEGDAIFTRTDGKTVTVKNVRVDSIGPSAESPMVIGVEFYGNDNVVHIPFVESWVIQYR